MLKQVDDCLLNDLVECPPPDDPDRQETRKVYHRRDVLDDAETSADEEMEDVDDEDDTVETFEGTLAEPSQAGHTHDTGITPSAIPPHIYGEPGVQGPTASNGKKQEDGLSKQQKSKPCKELPESMHMRQASEDFTPWVGLGGLMENGECAPEPRGPAAQDVFIKQLDGGTATGTAGGKPDSQDVGYGVYEGAEGGKKSGGAGEGGV